MKKLTLLFTVLFIGAVLFAQDEATAPAKHSDVTWHTVSVIDFKPGKAEDAKKLIAKFESAGVAAQTQSPIVYWFETGKYDMVVTWELEEGPADLEWSWSPDVVKWREAFVAQEGSEEAAQKLEDEYTSLIASSVKNVARKSK